jgi:hypothetical protein
LALSAYATTTLALPIPQRAQAGAGALRVGHERGHRGVLGAQVVEPEDVDGARNVAVLVDPARRVPVAGEAAVADDEVLVAQVRARPAGRDQRGE